MTELIEQFSKLGAIQSIAAAVAVAAIAFAVAWVFVRVFGGR